MSSTIAALSYHEPNVVTILILMSFLLVENAINHIFDRLLYCGLVGQIAIGVAWGAPGADWLSRDVQNTVMQLGYLGLILLVYEGGLQTNITTLKSNLFLSSLVAVLGISAPIGLSFALQGFANITPVQSFAAGAALCSTSLGTTFTIVSTSGLSRSRLGIVLSSAAMMDDIVGLIMSGIISILGQSSEFEAATIVRPVFVSVAFAVLLPVICALIVKPLTKSGHGFVAKRKDSSFYRFLTMDGTVFSFHILVISALVAGSSYAGTSNLFAAYLAGTSITWWDGLCKELRQDIVNQEQEQRQPSEASRDREEVPANANRSRTPSTSNISTSPSQTTTTYDHLSGSALFEKYIHPALQTVLKPFFFASIGFSIPISQMFSGSVVWRGMVYSVLMILGKVLCGLCLVRFSFPFIHLPHLRKLSVEISSCLHWPMKAKQSSGRHQDQHLSNAPDGNSQNDTDSQTSPPIQRPPSAHPQRSKIPKPMSLYPAALLGSAMVARGEIGFLISSVAESDGVFGPASHGQSSELFLIVTWAILLCTLLGPLAVGLMVRRVKRLQALERGRHTGREDPLGTWGIVS